MNDNEDMPDNICPVTDTWFVSSFPPRNNRQEELAMFTEWKEVMLYQDYFNYTWRTRFESVLSLVPGGPTERAGCIATSFALWLSMPVGHSFMNQLFISFHKRDEYYFKNIAAVKAWAEKNMMGGSTDNLLSRIVGARKEYFKEVTYADHRTVEATLLWFMTDTGTELYQRVMRNTRPDYIVPEKR